MNGLVLVMAKDHGLILTSHDIVHQISSLLMGINPMAGLGTGPRPRKNRPGRFSSLDCLFIIRSNDGRPGRMR